MSCPAAISGLFTVSGGLSERGWEPGRGCHAALSVWSDPGVRRQAGVRLRRYACLAEKGPLVLSGCRERPWLCRPATDVESEAGSWENSCKRRKTKVFGGRTAEDKRLTARQSGRAGGGRSCRNGFSSYLGPQHPTRTPGPRCPGGTKQRSSGLSQSDGAVSMVEEWVHVGP